MPDLIDRKAALAAVDRWRVHAAELDARTAASYLGGAMDELRSLPSPSCATCVLWERLANRAKGVCCSTRYGIRHGDSECEVMTPPDHSCAAYRAREPRP